MPKFQFRFVSFLVSAFCVGLAGASGAGAATINVNTTADAYGAGASCSLREAVTAANSDAPFGGCGAGSSAGRDAIVLAKGSRYTRAIDGDGEDANATGDLDIASSMSLGPKKGKATIDAGGFDRVLHILEDGDLNLSRVTITGAVETYPANPMPLTGAGALVDGALRTWRVRIAGNRTVGNSANNGGGLTVDGTAKLDRTTIVGNHADNVGGGIFFNRGSLRIRRSSILDNESGYFGGGLYLSGDYFGPDVIRLRDSTIARNQAVAGGGGLYGGLYNDVGTEKVFLSNVTLSRNRTDGSGGGILMSVGSISLNSTTVTGNVADDDETGGGDHGGGLAGGSISFINSIVSGNIDRNSVEPLDDCSGGSSGGHNLVGRSGGCFKGDTDRTRDAKLGPLERNGGPTATHALRRGSGAIGLAKKQTATKRDQRGRKRDKDPDSGAYERR